MEYYNSCDIERFKEIEIKRKKERSKESERERDIFTYLERARQGEREGER